MRTQVLSANFAVAACCCCCCCRLTSLQELDEAARRRMPKQLYIPLPCAEARRQLILRQLGPGAKVAADLSPTDLDKVSAVGKLTRNTWLDPSKLPVWAACSVCRRQESRATPAQKE
jgi:hypothetical protein